MPLQRQSDWSPAQPRLLADARPACPPPQTFEQKQLEDLDDASAELMLADDDDDDGGEGGGGGGVRMQVGAAFLYAPKDEAEARVEALTEEAKAKLGELEEEMAGLQGRMAELKVTLYGRLGSGNINLEE